MAEVKIYSTPSRLYRYRSLRSKTAMREITAITEGYIYCPKFADMNDPMEGMHRLSLGFILQSSKATQKRILTERNKLGIASLSEVKDHEPMWAHYADQFKGMCVEYNTRKLLEGLADDIDLVRMAYNERPPALLSTKDAVGEKARLTLSTKTVRWASEREWRLISPQIGAAHYGNVKCVTRIYLGARVSSQIEARVREQLGPLKIPVLKMKIDEYLIDFSRDGS